MKQLLVLLFVSFVCQEGSAQQTIDVTKDNYNAANFFNTVGGNPVSNAKFMRLAEGSPFFSNDWMKSTIITPQNVHYKDVSIKLDLLENNFHYLDPKGNELIASTAAKEIILHDPIKNKQFRFINSYSQPLLKSGWHIVLAEGKASLFKTMTKKISEYKAYGSSTTEQVIKTTESFVLVHNQQFLPLKNQKELLVILSDKKEELQAFVKKQDSKLTTEDKLIEAVNYYNSLFTK